MKGLRASAVVAVIAAIGAIPGVADAGRPARLMPGLYSYPGGPPPNPLISFEVLKIKGREVVADALVTCKSRRAPRAGVPANHPLVLRIPHSVPIMGQRTFTYSGLVRIFPVGHFSARGRTKLVLKGRFVGVARTRTATYPTGFRGSFASSVCASRSRAFSFPSL